MKVMVLGYGSREHALAWKLSQSPLVREVFVAPGNAGTAQIATNVPISDEDTEGLVEFALEQGIHLTVVGTNDPLALGVVDRFQEAGLAIFGPTQAAAQLEASKAFAKHFMREHGIPTPRFETFTTYDEANAYLYTLAPDTPLVVKVSGLGKMGMGVTVCDTIIEAREALHEYMVERVLGDSANIVLIEERVFGVEASVFALSDGTTAVPLMAVRDYKRIYDNDEGPNTGGVGAYGPPPDIDDAFIEYVMETVIRPTIQGMADDGHPYVGVLYAGLMITDSDIQVLEFNCRFGNPEALVIMALLENDLAEVAMACIEGRLGESCVSVRDGAAAAVVITSPGYPVEGFETGFPITGIRKANSPEDVEVFHHGTKIKDGQLVTARGRVLAVMATGENIPEAVERIYESADQIEFEGAHYRTDIAQLVQTT